ncbi:MAG: hypothetical protein AAF710_10810 [Planctomycetota bacterium]
MIDPAKPFSSRRDRDAPPAAAARADLTGLLDRARDERFRLLKMLKDARAEVALTAEKSRPASEPRPVAAPASDPDASTANKLQKLVAKLTALDAQLDAKFQRINQTTDTKLKRLEQLEERLAARIDQLGPTLKEGRDLHAALRDALAVADGLPAKITGQLERFDEHVAAHEGLGREAIDRYADEARQRLDADALAALATRRDRLVNEVREAAAVTERDLVARFDSLAESLDERAGELLARTESAGNAALANVRRQVVAAMARTHDTHEAFRSKLDEHRQQHADRLSGLADTADGQLLEQAQRLDERFAGLADLFDHQADQILAELRDRATGLLDQMADAVLKLHQPAEDATDDPDRRAA